MQLGGGVDLTALGGQAPILGHATHTHVGEPLGEARVLSRRHSGILLWENSQC